MKLIGVQTLVDKHVTVSCRRINIMLHVNGFYVVNVLSRITNMHLTNLQPPGWFEIEYHFPKITKYVSIEFTVECSEMKRKITLARREFHVRCCCVYQRQNADWRDWPWDGETKAVTRKCSCSVVTKRKRIRNPMIFIRFLNWNLVLVCFMTEGVLSQV